MRGEWQVYTRLKTNVHIGKLERDIGYWPKSE